MVVGVSYERGTPVHTSNRALILTTCASDPEKYRSTDLHPEAVLSAPRLTYPTLLLQGYRTYKKMHLPRILPQAYA